MDVLIPLFDCYVRITFIVSFLFLTVTLEVCVVLVYSINFDCYVTILAHFSFVFLIFAFESFTFYRFHRVLMLVGKSRI